MFGRFFQWNLSSTIKRRVPFQCQTRLLHNHIYIYAYTQKLHFEVSNLERFWSGSEEASGEVWELEIMSKHFVLQGGLMPTLKKPMVF